MTRDEFIQATRERGVSAMAAALGVSRAAVLSFAAGTERGTTRTLIESRMARLAHGKESAP